MITEKIADSLQNTFGYEDIIEIGPGQGVLTKYLLLRKEKLQLVEADRDMVGVLEHNFPEISDSITLKDVLKVDFSELTKGKSFGLIGNYPYNISSQIIFKMIDNKHLIPEMVGMFQKEVAERIVAAPGSKTYGVVSVLTQAWYTGKLLFTVAPGNFNPPPKVQSAVIRLTRKENEDLGCDYKDLRQVVKMSFNSRRKMLRNTLKSLGDAETLENPIFKSRPEELSVEQFVEITKMLKSK